MTNPISTRRWATYIDFQEAWEYLQIEEEPEGREATRLRRYIDSACTTAQNVANRPFAPTEFKERQDGWSGDTLQLYYSPFLTLIECREWQSSGGFVTLPESTPEEPIEGVQIDYATSQLTRTFSGYSWPRPFFPGHRNIEITYTAGFNPVPDDVWEATCELIMWKWRNTQQPTRTFALPGSDFDQTANDTGIYPGIPNRIGDVFEMYRIPGIG
jgi:hypothetical protein